MKTSKLLFEILRFSFFTPFIMTCVAYILFSPYKMIYLFFTSNVVRNDMYFFTCIVSLSYITSYFFFNMFYYYVLLHSNESKIIKQIDKNDDIYIKRRKAIFELIIKCFLSFLLSSFVYIISSYNEKLCIDRDLPLFGDLLLSFIQARILIDFFYYWTHRIFHLKWFYWIHKKHHSWTLTEPVCSDYTHVLEHSIVTFQFLFFSIIFGNHVLFLIISIVYRILQSVSIHSNVQFSNSKLNKLGFTFSDSSVFHLFHHKYNQGNYGISTFLWDYIFKSMDEFENNDLSDKYFNFKTK